MFEYVHFWNGQRAGLRTTEIDSATLRDMLHHIDSGAPVDWQGADPASVREQIRLVLDARAWSLL